MEATKISSKVSLNNLDTKGTRLELLPEDFKINLADEVPDPHPLISINEITICSPQNVGLIKAKAKQGKSFLATIIIAALLKGRWGRLVTSLLKDKYKVIYIDSEQAEAHVHKLARRVHRMCGYDTKANHPYFEVYYTKTLTNDERLELLEKIAKDPAVGFIVFDGVVDLVNDFNSLEECSKKKDVVLKLVGKNNIFLLGVIHENKKDGNSRGHWGAFWEQKSETTLQIEKDGDYFDVTPAFCRNIDIERFGFRIEDGLPVEVDATDRPNPKYIKQQDTIRKIISGTSTINYTDLINKYVDHTGVSPATAKRHIALLFSKNFLEKNERGCYWIKNNIEVS